LSEQTLNDLIKVTQGSLREKFLLLNEGKEIVNICKGIYQLLPIQAGESVKIILSFYKNEESLRPGIIVFSEWLTDFGQTDGYDHALAGLIEAALKSEADKLPKAEESLDEVEEEIPTFQLTDGD